MNDRPSVLIVDDDEGIRRTLEMILTKKNYQAFTAPDGKTALALAQEREFNLALLDIRLPDIAGTDLLAQFKALRPDLEVLIITGHATLESAIQGLATGAYHYFIKPLNVDELLVTLEKALHKQRLVLENRRLLQAVQSELEERNRAEDALRVSEERFRLAAESASDLIWEWDIVTGKLQWFGAIDALLGYAPGEFPRTIEAWEAVIHSDDHDRVMATLDRHLKNRAPYDEQYRVRRKDGPVGYWTDRGVALWDEQGKPYKMIGACTDITERKRVEEALRESETKYRTLVENSLIGIGISQGNRIVYANQALMAMYGYTDLEEFTSKLLLDYLTPQSQTFIKEWREKKARGEQVPLEFEHEIVRKDGAIRILQLSSAYLTLGNQNYVYTTFIDITERKQREREMQAVAAVSAALRTATTRGEMLPLILDQVQTLLNATAAVLITRDPVSGEAVIELARGTWGHATGRRIPPGQGVSARVLETGQPYVTNDLPNDPLFYSRDMIGNLRALANVPLIVQGRPIGLLSFGRLTPIAQEELRILTVIADIAGNALHRTALHEKTEQRLQHLTALRTIDQTINASLDLRFTLNTLLDQVVTQLRVDAADILLRNPVSQTLDYAAGRGFRTKGIERLSTQIGESYAGKVALERRVVNIRNLAQVTVRGHSSPWAGEGFVAYCGAPLVAKGQVTGVLEVFQRAPRSADSEWLSFLEMLAGQAALAIDNARLFDELQRSNANLALAYDATIEGWSRALDLRDQMTEGHTQRVAQLTEQLARASDLSEAEILHVHCGALLHDIGQIGVPDHILRKVTALTEQEWVIMRRHPEFGLDLLRPIPYLHAALDIPYCHHEKWDGSGYPRGLKGEAIPIAARIFALADVWDALRSARPYRAAWTDEQARAYLREQAGRHFDPNLVERFLKLMR